MAMTGRRGVARPDRPGILPFYTQEASRPGTVFSHSNRLSPNNIKTNPNYLHVLGQRSPRPREKTRGESTQRARSLIVLGTSSSGRPTRKGLDGNTGSDHDSPGVTPRPRGLSNPDITQYRSRGASHDTVPVTRANGTSTSGSLVTNDLDCPSYERGLSSPDLGDERGRKLKRTKDRSVSLDMLRRSHDCLREGANGACKCTVKLYRSESTAVLPRGTSSASIAGRMAHRKKNISDTDVTSFFSPSPMAWKHGPRRSLDQSQSVEDCLDGSSLSSGRNLRATPVQKSKPQKETSNNDAPSISNVKRSTSLPSRSAWSTTDVKLSDNRLSMPGPPKPPRFDPEGMRKNNHHMQPQRAMNGMYALDPPKVRNQAKPMSNDYTTFGKVQSIIKPNIDHGPSEMLSTRKPLMEKSPCEPGSQLDDKKYNSNPVERETLSRKSTAVLPVESVNSLDNSQKKVDQHGSNKKITSSTKSTLDSISTTPARSEVKPPPSQTSSGSEPLLHLTSKQNTMSPKSDTQQDHSNGDKSQNADTISTPSTKQCKSGTEYKPLYYEMVEPSKRWFKSYSREQNPVSSTYFVSRDPVLDRHISSYKYNNTDDKVKVMALLDRYAASGRSNLGLSRQEMTNYLNCTKRQLGLVSEPKADPKIPLDPGRVNQEPTDPNKSTSQQGKEANDREINRDGLSTKDRSPSVATKMHTRKVVEKQDKENVAPDCTDLNDVHNDSIDGACWEDKPTMTAKLREKIKPNQSTIPMKSLENVRKRSRIKAKIAFPHESATALLKENKQKNEGRTSDSGICSPDLIMLPQTTFHVDGGITNTPAARRRTLIHETTNLRRRDVTGDTDDVKDSLDDVNNNADDKYEEIVCGLSERAVTRPGDIIFTTSIPYYSLWRPKGALPRDVVPPELMQFGVTMGTYQQVCPLLNDSIRNQQLLSNMNTWLYGSYLSIAFLVVWLFGVLVTYLLDFETQWCAIIVFLVSSLIISCLAWTFHYAKQKVVEKKYSLLMRCNRLLCDEHVLAVVAKGKSWLPVTNLHLVHYETDQCQDRLIRSIEDKETEDRVLTQISVAHNDLMEFISHDLDHTSTATDDIGKEVIVHDILMYFVCPYLEDFLSNKKFSTDGKVRTASHPQHCLCCYVQKTLAWKPPPEDDHSPLRASRPTLI